MPRTHRLVLVSEVILRVVVIVVVLNDVAPLSKVIFVALPRLIPTADIILQLVTPTTAGLMKATPAPTIIALMLVMSVYIVASRAFVMGLPLPLLRA